jgi:hypothetical protein
MMGTGRKQRGYLGDMAQLLFPISDAMRDRIDPDNPAYTTGRNMQDRADADLARAREDAKYASKQLDDDKRKYYSDLSLGAGIKLQKIGSSGFVVARAQSI